MNQIGLIALVLVTLAVTPIKSSNDLVIGHRVIGDELIQLDNIRKYNVVPLRQISIEKTYAGDSKITQIRALDMDKNDRGGTATITAGGIGQSLVTVKFNNKLSLAPTAIDFKVKIYGVKLSSKDDKIPEL